MLYPRENEIREVKDISGIWNFKVDFYNKGYEEKWYSRPLEEAIMMPVPASYNDITQDIRIRDHIGDVWYEKKFYISKLWDGQRIVIRVGSACHKAVMWINGEKVAAHKGGYLPFEADITEFVNIGEENRVTICVNNILDWTTIPCGKVKEYSDDSRPEGYKVQEYFHDFFNYSGIHRPVKLYTTPKNFISDITVKTDYHGKEGVVSYDISVETAKRKLMVEVYDEAGEKVGEAEGGKGNIIIENVHLWQPLNSYLYTLKAMTFDEEGNLEDCYSINVGVRTVRVTEKEFLVNDKPFYFKGFGKHEDMDIKGKGLDDVINVKDFNLLKWINANSFRTSHYPYAEEIMDMADRQGIVVIDETTAVGFNFWNENEKVFCEEHVSDKTLEHHLQVVQELVQRDKNHACVVMWSAANEAATYEEEALPYFKKVSEEFRKLDETRPITIVNCCRPNNCKVAQLFDVVCVNRYFSWYEDPGHLEVLEYMLEKELRGWHENFKKPVMITEFGADTIPGFHSDPPVMFTEEYQNEVLRLSHNVFDRLDFFIGEHVWNFADFATKQGVTRIVGNKKGVFTRQRQPKSSAFILKERWSKLK